MTEPIKIIRQYFQTFEPGEFDPVEFLDYAKKTLADACMPGEAYDLRSPKTALKACNAYGSLANMLFANGLNSSALDILINAWNRFGDIQREENQRIYRAALAFYLAKKYLQLDDKGAAFRWALLAQADDILGEHEKRGGAGKQLLLTALGMAEENLSLLNEIASSNLSKVHVGNNGDWTKPEAYAEDAVLKFALTHPETAHLFTADSSLSEFPITPAYYSALFQKLNNNNILAADKGKSLEDLATYLFLLIPGLCPRRNVLDKYQTYESDLVIRNLSRHNKPVTEILGRHFLVECKNWESPVGVSDVGYFLYRMRLTHVEFGVIFAKNGITGDREEEKAARSIIRKAFHEDRNICIVIDEKDLIALKSRQFSFRSLLFDRVEEIRFGRPRQLL